MEDLLASIRKAIHEDIGETAPPAAAPAASSGARERAAAPAPRPSAHETQARVSEELASAASEIKQLREKITRTRGVEPAAPALPPRDTSREPAREPARDLGQRAAGLSAALQSEKPRRSWRELETPPPAPQPPGLPPARLRPAVSDAEAQRGFARPDPASAPRADLLPPRHEPAQHGMAHAAPHAAQPLPPLQSLSQPPSHGLPPLPRAGLPTLRPEASPARPGLEHGRFPDTAAMLSGPSAHAVHSAFAKLSETVSHRPGGERAIEDMTRDMLRGMLKQWLDDHLPGLVERLVREEIERVVRPGR